MSFHLSFELLLKSLMCEATIYGIHIFISFDIISIVCSLGFLYFYLPLHILVSWFSV